MKYLRTVSSIFAIAALWTFLSYSMGEKLFPSLAETFTALLRLFLEADASRQILITFFRVVSGLVLGCLLAVLPAIICGRRKTVMDLFSPIVFAAQGCPTIIWVSLVLIWAGAGSVVPITAIILVVFPIFFFNIAQGISSIDARLFLMARLYKLSPRRILGDILCPGVYPSLSAALSYSLGVSWRVAVTAEFISSSSGIGAQVYWAYRKLQIPELFAWTLFLVAIGVSVDFWIASPLRRKVSTNAS